MVVEYIGLGAASGGGAAPASSPGCLSSAIRRAIRHTSSPGSKSAESAPKAAGHVGGGHKPNAVFAHKQAVVRSPACPPRFPRTAPRCLGPLLAPHYHRATPRTQPRTQPGHNLGAHGGKYRSTREGPQRARRQLAARSDGCRGKPKGPPEHPGLRGRCRAGRATGALVPCRGSRATTDVKW